MVYYYYTFLKNIFHVLLTGKINRLGPPKQTFLFANSSVADFILFM